MIDVLLSFDTEDPIHPEADDALLRLCRTMADAGVPGNFFLVGEKARVLRERGRRDVLDAVAEHEVDYHGNYWFEFPECTMVYGDRLEWDEAVDRATQIELNGLHDVAEITGHWPVAWVQHQNNQAAMMPLAMRRLGVPVWNGGFGSGAMCGWLMDQLVITRNAHGMSLQGTWGGWDQDPLNPTPPERVMDPAAEFRAFQERVDQVASQHGTVVPLGHPTCWAMAEWWGWYEWDELCHYRTPEPYPRGRVFRRVPRRNAADVEAHFAWTRRVCDWLAARADVNVTTFGQILERHRERGTRWLSLDEVDAVAAACADGPRHLALADTTLSAADALGVLVHVFNSIARRATVPHQVPLQRLTGPVEAPWPARPVECGRAVLFALAGQLYDYLVTWRRLPGVMRARVDLGPAAATMLYARAWQHYRAHGTWPEKLAIEPSSDLPAAAAMEFFARPSAASSHAPPGFTPQALADRVRWQSWSYRDLAACE
jgi:hypothetical protein